MIEQGSPTAPYNVSWLLTNNCNYDCGFCWRVLDRSRLPLDDAIRITHSLADAGMLKMSWAGGEPLLYKGIRALIKETHARGVETMLITNGSLLERLWPDGLLRELDWLTLPLEGVGEEMNVRAGRDSGHFSRVDALFRKFHPQPVKLKLNSVALAFNLDSLMKIPEHLDDWGVERWKIFQFYPVRGFAEKNRVEYELSDAAFEDFRGAIQSRCSALGVASSVVVESRADLDNSYYTLSPDGCVYVSMDGADVYLGDLKVEDPRVVFQSPLLSKAKYQRRSEWILDLRSSSGKEGAIDGQT